MQEKTLNTETIKQEMEQEKLVKTEIENAYQKAILSVGKQERKGLHTDGRLVNFE